MADKKDWLELLVSSNRLAVRKAVDEYAGQYGLSLTDEEVGLLLCERKQALREQERVEFGDGILSKLIYAFCDSPYVYQDNFADTLGRLQEIFYLYKNESLDELTDDELIECMKREFDGICQGSLDYLEDTSLEKFARKIRYGEADEDEDEEGEEFDDL